MSSSIDFFHADIAQAKEWYGNTTNTTGVPLIVHSTEVAQILVDIQNEIFEFKDYDFLIALRSSLAHDVLEDTGVSADTIAAIWGMAVLQTIVELSNSKGDSDFNAYIEFLSADASDITRVVKLADILANVRNSLRQFEEINISWMQTFWIPLLHRYEATVLVANSMSFPDTSDILRLEIKKGIDALEQRIRNSDSQ